MLQPHRCVLNLGPSNWVASLVWVSAPAVTYERDWHPSTPVSAALPSKRLDSCGTFRENCKTCTDTAEEDDLPTFWLAVLTFMLL